MALLPLQDIDGDSDDDIPELEEQVGGDDSAEVSGKGFESARV